MPIIVMTLTSFVIAVFIVLVDNKLKEEEKEIKEIENLLPGLNCGSCGFGTCKGMAEKILENKENYIKCKPLRGEKLEKFLEEIKK